MRRSVRLSVIFGLCSLVSLHAAAQQPKPGLLTGEELKRLAPSVYFFDGQSASTQTRNTVGFRNTNGKLTLAGFVDTSGYASDVAQKYQGFFITEGKLNIEGSELPPGEYGFGFSKDGKFIVMDVSANDLLSATATTDDKLSHPVPLKMVEDNGGYKLYAGKKWVAIKPE